jgi:hypothetical protein
MAKIKSNDDDIDTLFTLPLAEFTSARNALAARFNRDGRATETQRVKAMAKPSISAWAVNQLYWHHREAFEELIDAAERYRSAQASGRSGRIADMRGALDARREALWQLSELATSLLRDAGHSPTPDTIRRVNTTLEGLSAYVSHPDGPTPGRLTQDVDPPGFESLTSFIPGVAKSKRTDQPASLTQSRKSVRPSAKVQPHSKANSEVLKVKETREARIAAAKTSVRDAKRSLADARTRAQRLEKAQKKADAQAKKVKTAANEAEKELREAEQRFKKASAAAAKAAQDARTIEQELDEAAKALADAQRTVEKASKELFEG